MKQVSHLHKCHVPSPFMCKSANAPCYVVGGFRRGEVALATSTLKVFGMTNEQPHLQLLFKMNRDHRQQPLA